MHPSAETVRAIPLSLNGSDPLQEVYVANFSQNIQFAAANQFVTGNLLGDVIVTEQGSGAFDVHYVLVSKPVDAINEVPNSES